MLRYKSLLNLFIKGGISLNTQSNKNLLPVVETALLSAVAVILFLGAKFLPVLGIGFALVCPAPIVLIGIRHPLKIAVIGTVIASFIISAMSGILAGFSFFLGFGILGISMGRLISLKRKFHEILLLSILISLGGKLLLMVLYSFISGFNPFYISPKEASSMVNKVIEIYKSFGIDENKLTEIKKQLQTMVQFLPILFPSILATASAIDVYLSYNITRLVSKRIFGDDIMPPFPPFIRWRFHISVVWVFVISIAMIIVSNNPQSFLYKTGVNLRALSSMLLMIQGISVIAWWLNKKGMPKITYIILFVAVFIIPLLSQIATIIGITDSWFNFRKLGS